MHHFLVQCNSMKHTLVILEQQARYLMGGIATLSLLASLVLGGDRSNNESGNKEGQRFQARDVTGLVFGGGSVQHVQVQPTH